jgi:hypothetical protein
MPLREHGEQLGFGEPNLFVVRHAAARTCRTAWVDQIYLSFDMPLREHGEQRGSENQIYLSFDMPLREHGEQRGLNCNKKVWVRRNGQHGKGFESDSRPLRNYPI